MESLATTIQGPANKAIAFGRVIQAFGFQVELRFSEDREQVLIYTDASLQDALDVHSTLNPEEA